MTDARGGRRPPRRRGGRPRAGGRPVDDATSGASTASSAPAPKRVDRRIQVGIVVQPTDVLARLGSTRLVEADASGEPLVERVTAPWVEQAPEHAVIDVRAHRLLTHHAAAVESLWPEVRDLLSPALRAKRQVYADDLPARALDLAYDRFVASVGGLREHGRLGAVVFPFPSYFVPGRRARDYLEWLRGRSGDLPIAVELRHRDWVTGKERESTLAFLSEHGLSLVCVDAPSGFESSLPPLSVVTTDTAFVRFHGRNADAWERGVDTGDDRFPYDYREGDLEPWVARLEKLASSSRAVHVVLSGRNPEAAARNARLLVRVLRGEKAPRQYSRARRAEGGRS